ncbi:MAG: hypothetical protein LBO07_05535 [Coriobacteriales bacterium]|jgi:hypothetical protein|nr:hypothetical protein [Coriobacteriales bacterium]
MGFAQLAASIIKRKGCYKAVFIERSHLLGRTYGRIMRDKVPNPTLDTVMAL